jgi:Uma2 family endonuclease
VESPVKNKLEYRDLLAIPDDGKRYELLDGEVSVTPAPSPVHQRIVLALAVRFIEYFHARGIGEVFVSPLDVILTDRDVIEPDVVVVGRPAQISHRGIEGSPLLVVEVLSPSTRERDRTVKAQRCARLGIRHYWIVDPEARRVECLRESAGAYELVLATEGDQTLVHPDWPALAVDLGALWRGWGVW